MHAKAGRPMLVAGAGIGGLSAAIALGRRGVPVHVLEAEAEFAEVGAGLQIGPNGGRIIDSWGLGETLRSIAARPQRLVIRDGLTNAHLASMPLGDEIERRHGAPYQVVERRRLHRVLLEAARATPGVTISSAFRVTSVDGVGEGVRVTGNDRRSLEGRGLICADGVRSQLRAFLFDGATASPSGKIAWRATIDPAEAPSVLKQQSGRTTKTVADSDTVSLWLAPDTHLVIYLCGPNGPLNAVAIVDEAATGGRNASGGTPELMSDFAAWAPEIRDFLRRFTGWTKWPLMRVRPLKHWSRGAVTLLGDAAHPLLPFLASGAVMALEDAEVLAVEVARSPEDVAAAFQRYEARRLPRANRVMVASARMGQIYHMSGAMRLARNIALAAMPRHLLLARNDWLYGYRVSNNVTLSEDATVRVRAK